MTTTSTAAGDDGPGSKSSQTDALVSASPGTGNVI
eukprot:CAMPEP_0181061514 /NCGR_PEP_ID=MMETSP1070-20121207/22567_1 /TAXON_ID=265543 /ORGANISM="Minutocellus polymorphus, Strain NH13" /LENGTH=34 /DNA_ID= /DNA_START= /DNA_END= /DNA_ORIENTATION=